MTYWNVSSNAWLVKATYIGLYNSNPTLEPKVITLDLKSHTYNYIPKHTLDSTGSSLKKEFQKKEIKNVWR